MADVQLGLEAFLAKPPRWINACRLAVLCNSASVDRNFVHVRDLINARFPGQLKALLAPQHGFHAEKQDNMVESDDMTDPGLKIPIYSLYGRTRRPSEAMFEGIDALIVDLQDVGTRVYTFIYTMSYCLEAAQAFGRKVLVLDRPNPVGGTAIEGNCLSAAYKSFVGRYEIPMRHGLTIGELAMLFNTHFGIGADLEVIPMKNWRRKMLFEDTGLPWVPPSPNLPTATAAMLYPGQVIWEGTNISEGRGTTQPFEIFGAPFLDPHGILEWLGGRKLPGGLLRPIGFEPTSNKWQGKLCKGFQIHLTDPSMFAPYHTSLKLLQALLHLHKGELQWKAPPYEYEYEKLPIDLILGDIKIRKRLEALEPLESIESSWTEALKAYREMSRSVHLYN